MYGDLMRECRLSLYTLGGMTDEQILALFARERGLKKNYAASQRARKALDRYKKKSFKETFIEDFTRGNPALVPQAEALFARRFPNYAERDGSCPDADEGAAARPDEGA